MIDKLIEGIKQTKDVYKRQVWPGAFGFTYVENTGAAFGVLGKSTLVLTVVSALAMVVLCFVLVKFRKELSKFGRVGLALIIAGGLGNLIDRVFLGYVVDFINLEFMQFAVFNVDVYKRQEVYMETLELPMER